MTFEQAQLYIRIFILQHYDKKLCDVVPSSYHGVKVNSLFPRIDGNWAHPIDENFSRIIIWSSISHIEEFGKIVIRNEDCAGINFNIQDYVNLKEEKI